MKRKKALAIISALGIIATSSMAFASTPNVNNLGTTIQLSSENNTSQEDTTQRNHHGHFRGHQGQGHFGNGTPPEPPKDENGNPLPLPPNCCNCQNGNGDCTPPEPPKDENGNPLPPPNMSEINNK